MDPGRIGDAQIMNSERGGVGHDRLSPAPQRPPDEVIMFALREIDELPEAIDAAIDARPVTLADLIVLRLVGVTVLKGLARSEVATLVRCPSPEPHTRRVFT